MQLQQGQLNNSQQGTQPVNPQANQQQIITGAGNFQDPQINLQQNQNYQVDTLDEPVHSTILRDIRMICHKLKYVLLPRFREEGGKELRNWDLWGPLLLCLLLAFTLGLGSNQGTDQLFGIIFMIIWGGAFVVTLNSKILGGDVSILQSVCVLGYCIFPINIGAVGIYLLKSMLPFILKLAIVIASFLWSSLSSVAFVSSMIDESKKVIAVYPIFLFYLFLSWFCLFI